MTLANQQEIFKIISEGGDTNMSRLIKSIVFATKLRYLNYCCQNSNTNIERLSKPTIWPLFILNYYCYYNNTINSCSGYTNSLSEKKTITARNNLKSNFILILGMNLKPHHMSITAITVRKINILVQAVFILQFDGDLSSTKC